MSEIQAQIALLKQTADAAVADAIARLIDEGEDHELNRINVLDFSKRSGLDEERVISGFLHASRLGLFDLTWNVLCPGCGGVLDAHSTLRSEEHTSELQSRRELVCRLLLEKKKIVVQCEVKYEKTYAVLLILFEQVDD